mmetsp:Transcript_71795/g.199230  ORF Transcript_71795/g.199230 Transcript_71795/m.199230 type:complete len:225 (-) Transcript_71795:151-825(-)
MRFHHLLDDAVADAQYRGPATATQVNSVVALWEEVRQVPADALSAQVWPTCFRQRETDQRKASDTSIAPLRPSGGSVNLVRFRGRNACCRCGGTRRMDWRRQEAFQLDRIEVAGLEVDTRIDRHTTKPHCGVSMNDNDKSHCWTFLPVLVPRDAWIEKVTGPRADVDAAKRHIRETRERARIRNGEYLALGVPLVWWIMSMRRYDAQYERMRPMHHDASLACLW